MQMQLRRRYPNGIKISFIGMRNFEFSRGFGTVCEDILTRMVRKNMSPIHSYADF